MQSPRDGGVCGLGAGSSGHDLELDALKALKTAGGWARVRRGCPARERRELWRVGQLWGCQEAGRAAPGARR